MPSINFTIRNPALSEGKFSGTVEVSGQDFDGNDYKHEKEFSIDVEDKFEIPVGSLCKIEGKVWLASPNQLCVDGHLQCLTGRQPTSGPFCVNV